MVIDSEFWTVVINGSANLVIAGAMFLQTIIFLVTFIFGFKYLDQHRSKVKIEKNVELAEKIIFGLNQMVDLIDSYFQATDVYSVNDFIEKKSPLEVPKEFVNIYAKLLIINKNIDEKSDKINALYSQLSVYVEFLKDSEARILFFSLRSAHAQIVDDLYFNLMELQQESDFFLEKLTLEKRLEYIKSQKKKYQAMVPKSYYDFDFEGLKNYRRKLVDLKEQIIENQVP